MYARSAALGILGAIALALPRPSAPAFTLESTGAFRLRAAGPESRYGVVPQAVRGRPILALTLGAETGGGALYLALPGDRLPAPGRYPIRSSWDEIGSEPRAFRASFMAGTAEHPQGWFHGESGWVTITAAQAGQVSGTFEVQARGFLAADPADETRQVTVRGRFAAAGDSAVTAIASVQ
jgi:hypothetical protein